MHADDLALIARHLSIRPGSVLDVGCGPGHLTAHLRSLEVDATGIDLVPEFIDRARTTYPEGRYELGSIHELPTPDNAVAGILAWYSLIHLAPEEFDGVLAEQKPMHERAKMYEEDPQLVRNIIADGCEKARKLAQETMRDVREAIGLDYP